MSKIYKNSNPIPYPKHPEKGGYYLDTLAQLVTFSPKQKETKHLQKKSESQLNLQKRARAKALTESYLYDLIDLNSPLNKSSEGKGS